jgi:hypothetical protein
MAIGNLTLINNATPIENLTETGPTPLPVSDRQKSDTGTTTATATNTATAIATAPVRTPAPAPAPAPAPTRGTGKRVAHVPPETSPSKRVAPKTSPTKKAPLSKFAKGAVVSANKIITKVPPPHAVGRNYRTPDTPRRIPTPTTPRPFDYARAEVGSKMADHGLAEQRKKTQGKRTLLYVSLFIYIYIS